MEKEKIDMARQATGVRLSTWKGADSGRGSSGWYLWLGFYWFGVMFTRNWDGDFWTGIVFAWKLNPAPNWGSLIWLKSKKWGRYAA